MLRSSMPETKLDTSSAAPIIASDISRLVFGVPGESVNDDIDLARSTRRRVGETVRPSSEAESPEKENVRCILESLTRPSEIKQLAVSIHTLIVVVILPCIRIAVWRYENALPDRDVHWSAGVRHGFRGRSVSTSCCQDIFSEGPKRVTLQIMVYWDDGVGWWSFCL
jgi:hypothetical protein